MSDDRAPARLSPPSGPQQGYRPVSVMAVVSIVAAGCSLLSLINMWLILVGAVASLFAIWTILQLRNDREYAGVSIAWIALLFSLTTMMAGIAQQVVRTTVLSSQARQMTDRFIDEILTYRLIEAFEWTRKPGERIRFEDPSQLIESFPGDYRVFLRSDLVKTLKGQLETTQIGFSGSSSPKRISGWDEVKIGYTVVVNDQRWQLELVVRGGQSPSRRWNGRLWYIHKIDFNAEVLPTAPAQ